MNSQDGIWREGRAPLLLAFVALALALPAVASHEPPDVHAQPTVSHAAVDGSGRFLEAGWDDATTLSWWYEPDSYVGSMYWVAREITGAGDYWDNGYTGKGVDVALIDTGVVPVPGLGGSDKIVHGPDLSFESQADNLRYLDTYGHGTHMGGIIAGRDDEISLGYKSGSGSDRFLGMAPDSRIVNVKVADHEGAVDVSQVIAAINWVIEHRTDNGLNVRVINLSFGTDSVQEPHLDPLAYAVEQAWKSGLVVVVAAGNDGNASPLRDPAFNPYVIAVGASDSLQTYSTADDVVSDFSNCGNGNRHVDLVAPGQSIVSLRNPGSSADINHPEAVVSDRFFLGSGTSQAAAVVSGAAALIIQQRPDITPDQLKALLMNTAQVIPRASEQCQGAGLIDLRTARTARTPNAKQKTKTTASGLGRLEGARGSAHLSVDGVVLAGEQDIFGQEWNAELWAKLTANHATWDGGIWNGNAWSGTSWSGTSWSGTSWSGTSWSGTSWSDYVWSGTSWSGTSWSGTSWSGTSWSGTSWSGTSWSGSNWLGLSWG